MKRKFDPLTLIAGENILENITHSSFCVRKDHKDEDRRAMYIYKGNGLCKRHFKDESDKE